MIGIYRSAANTTPHVIHFDGFTQATTFEEAAKHAHGGTPTSGGSTSGGSTSGSNVTATASTHETSNTPQNTLDNNLSTRWSGQGDGAWIRYDLGETKTIQAIKIAFSNGNINTNTFDIQTSGNGSTWNTVLSNHTSSGTTNNLQTFSLGGVSARYIRYVGHGNSSTDFSDWNSLTEVGFITEEDFCHTITSPNTFPTTNSYAPPYTTLTTAQELMIRITCGTDTTANITTPNDNKTHYIYAQGLIRNQSTNTWEPVSLTSSTPVTADWLKGSAEGSIPSTHITTGTHNYFLGFVCTWTGSTTGWKCGCADSTCATPKWQLQIFRP